MSHQTSAKYLHGKSATSSSNSLETNVVVNSYPVFPLKKIRSVVRFDAFPKTPAAPPRQPSLPSMPHTRATRPTPLPALPGEPQLVVGLDRFPMPPSRPTRVVKDPQPGSSQSPAFQATLTHGPPSKPAPATHLPALPVPPLPPQPQLFPDPPSFLPPTRRRPPPRPPTLPRPK